MYLRTIWNAISSAHALAAVQGSSRSGINVCLLNSVYYVPYRVHSKASNYSWVNKFTSILGITSILSTH